MDKDWKNILKYLGSYTCIVMTNGATLMKINNNKIEQNEQLIETMLKSEYKQKMSNEINEIFENLEEGIIVLKNNTVNFTNNNFIDILK